MLSEANEAGGPSRAKFHTRRRIDKPRGLLSHHHTRPLNTLRGILGEQARIYRSVINGALTSSEGTKLTYILKEVRCTMESVVNAEATEAAVNAAKEAATAAATPFTVNIVSVPSGHFEQQDGSFAPDIPGHLQIEHAPQQISAPRRSSSRRKGQIQHFSSRHGSKITRDGAW